MTNMQKPCERCDRKTFLARMETIEGEPVLVCGACANECLDSGDLRLPEIVLTQAK